MARKDALPDFDALTQILDGDSDRCRLELIKLEQTLRDSLDITLGSPPGCNTAWLTDLSRALLQSTSGSATEQRVELLLLLVQWYYTSGNSQLGIEVAQRAVDLAESGSAAALKRRALSNLGILQIDMKDLTAATLSFVQAIEIAERLGDRIGKCASLSNLASARFGAGLLDDAIKLYQYVLDLASNEPHLSQLRTDAHHNIALACLLLSNMDAARSHMEAALKLCTEPRTQFMASQRVVMEGTFAKILVRLKDNRRARQRADMAAAYARPLNSRLADIQADLAGALCDAAEGQVDIALTRLARLRSEVRVSEPAYRDVLEAELECNRLAGRHQYAKFYGRAYLSNLAEWQRRLANDQFAVIRRSLRNARVSARDLVSLPAEIEGQFVNDPSNIDTLAQVEAIAILAETREDATGQHSYRVGVVSAMIARELGFSSADCQRIEISARLHDIGKLAIPDVILLKRGRLTKFEREIMQRHTFEGCQILTDLLTTVESQPRQEEALISRLRLSAEIALYHHESWDGSGYPRNVFGTAIPIEARIVALADVYDELTHARPYKTPISADVAVEQLRALSGEQFDPSVFKAFTSAYQDISKGNVLSESELPIGPVKHFLDANRVINRIARASSRDLSVGQKSASI